MFYIHFCITRGWYSRPISGGRTKGFSVTPRPRIKEKYCVIKLLGTIALVDYFWLQLPRWVSFDGLYFIISLVTVSFFILWTKRSICFYNQAWLRPLLFWNVIGYQPTLVVSNIFLWGEGLKEISSCRLFFARLKCLVLQNYSSIFGGTYRGEKKSAVWQTCYLYRKTQREERQLHLHASSKTRSEDASVRAATLVIKNWNLQMCTYTRGI